MHILLATLTLTASVNARVDRPPCVGSLAIRLSAPDPLGDFLATGVYTFALVERVRAVRAAGPRGSAHRRADLDRVAGELDGLDRALNDLPGGDDAPFGGIGSGRADYAIYRGLRGNREVIAISRARDKFRLEIEVGEDADGRRAYVVTGLNGTLGDANEAVRMTAHRFPARRA